MECAGNGCYIYFFLPILLTEMLVEIPSIVRAGDSVGGMIELLIEWILSH